MFKAKWSTEATAQYQQLKDTAMHAKAPREQSGSTKSSKQEAAYKQVYKAIEFLKSNPRHPSLNTHVYASMPHPWNKGEKVFEAYAQNNTPGAYRIFWCYGRGSDEITILAITPHP